MVTNFQEFVFSTLIFLSGITGGFVHASPADAVHLADAIHNPREVVLGFFKTITENFRPVPNDKFVSSSQEDASSSVPQTISEKDMSTQRADISTQVRAPDGWTTFELNDEQMGIAFMYPDDWQLKVSTSSEYLRSIDVSGDGYAVDICNACGTDGPIRGFTQPTYYIGGYKVTNIFEFFDGKKYSQMISMEPAFDDRSAKNTILIKLRTPFASKEITDRILSSIIFLK